MVVKDRIRLHPKTETLQPTPAQKPEPLPVDLSYFRPKKKQISIRMDADILAWFQTQPGKYQQLINKACRFYMHHHRTEFP